MLIKKPPDIKPSEITDKSLYLRRREFLSTSIRSTAAVATASLAGDLFLPSIAQAGAKLQGIVKSPLSTNEELTPYEDVTTYNNFYEFGTDKEDPAEYSKDFKPLPWTIAVEGACNKPGTFQFEDFIKPHQLEERIYRLRCVEAWSMVIPWVGFPLADVIKRFEPTGNAKYVAFTTLLDPKRMPGQTRPVLDWPYVEGLRMDEAMHPLTILAVGLYGEMLPNPNGAPIRLVVPWKYGFKGIKSIVKIAFTETQPPTTWNNAAPGEYGFYSNVNPNHDHPRWTQKKERRIGDLFKRPTLMFNGYADQVASLYAGMDLDKYY
ncbi:MAG TPA: protein-methionine-sulfoxide reductase catalytic subunit MsrP [Gammaproteobacteria bacterium]|nr:protein-methionine-sulfoxide reductase catalytic subunit MsrP [Gammaproteobacteria bacterium]